MSAGAPFPQRPARKRPGPLIIQLLRMEFRCRLVTATGEIVEGNYAAESEARLRHELEHQGLHVLSLRKKHLLAGGLSGLARRRKIPRHEFMVFNQEFATLLKAGMPLVQSIHLLRQQVTSPLFK